MVGLMKCLDTFILVQIHDNKIDFEKYVNQESIIPHLIMAEFYGILYRRFNQQTAEYWYKRLHHVCVPVPISILFLAIKFKADNKKENLSFFDCVGYIYAQEHNIPFVTGDSAFQHRKGVEFIA